MERQSLIRSVSRSAIWSPQLRRGLAASAICSPTGINVRLGDLTSVISKALQWVA